MFKRTTPRSAETTCASARPHDLLEVVAVKPSAQAPSEYAPSTAGIYLGRACGRLQPIDIVRHDKIAQERTRVGDWASSLPAIEAEGRQKGGKRVRARRPSRMGNSSVHGRGSERTNTHTFS
jgi:hypothetical protein